MLDITFKHLQGQHNQKKHGFRGSQIGRMSSMSVGGLEYSPDPELVQRVESSILDYASEPARTEIKRQIESELARIARDHPVGVRVPYDSAIMILESGRVKTQFETNTSQGMYSTKLRARAEDYGLGIPRDLDPTKRPVYGYFMGAAQNDGASGYGEIIFELKPSIKNRTTITQGDSLNGFADGKQIGTPARNPGIGSVKFDDYHQNNPMIKQGLRNNEFLLDRNIDYFEAQIYGGVSVKDVMMVRFGPECFNPKTMKLMDNYADLAEKFYLAGVDVEITRPFNQGIFEVEKELKLKEFDPYLEKLQETLGVKLLGFWDSYSSKKNETWTEGFLEALAAGIIAAYMLGRGDTDGELSEEEIDQLQGYIEEQSQYLDGFAASAGAISPAMGAARAAMYAAALTLPFWWGRTRYLDLPAYPGDGSSSCLTRCRCHWDIVPIDEDAGDYDCSWVLGFAEHCPECAARAVAWNPLQVRGWNYSTSQKEVLAAVALKHLQGEHNQRAHGYRGAKTEVRQSAKKNIETEPPTLPAQLNHGTMRDVQERQKERVAIMEKTYPGVQFSPATANPLAAKANAHLKGAGVPRAILDQKAADIDDPALHARLRLAYDQTIRDASGARTAASSFTLVKYASGLTFQQVFGIINSMRRENPKSVYLSVDRAGKAVIFGLRDASGMPI